MIDALWIAKTGMSAQQTQLDVIAHNLANVSTTGYKRSNAMFEDLIYQNLRQVGANSTEQNQLPTGLQLGLGVRTVATSRCFVQGSLQESRNNLDVAINGNGFFQVTLPDGSLGYTRDGSFQVDAQGRLVTANGLPVANGITIAANAISVSITPQGAVSAIIPRSLQPHPRPQRHRRQHRPRGPRAPHHPRQRPAPAAGQPGDGQLHQPGRPGADRAEPVQGIGRLGPAPARHTRQQRPGRDQTGLSGSLEHQHRRRTGDDDPDAAGLRNELQGHTDLGPDAGQAQPVVICAGMPAVAPIVRPIMVPAAMRRRPSGLRCAQRAGAMGLLLCAGCTSLAPVPPPLDILSTTAPALAAAAQGPRPVTGGLFHNASYRPAFEDRRARMVGDSVTIQI